MSYVGGICKSADGKMYGAYPTGNAPVGNEAFNYRKWGVPYITDALPGISGSSSTIPIMPTLPNGAYYTAHEWYGISSSEDPVLRVKPTVNDPTGWPSTENSLYMYVNKFDTGNATDTNNTYGYPNQPRLTIPNTIPAGVKCIFVVGNNTDNQSYDYSWNDEGTISGWQGTVATPNWVIGINNPNIARKLTWSNCKHIIIDGINVVWDGAANRGAQWDLATGTKYFTIRNSGMYGILNNTVGTSNGGAAFQISGTSDATCDFVVMYNCEVAYHGGYALATGEQPLDYHAFRPQFWCRYLWCIDSHLHHVSGDSMQAGNSYNTVNSAGILFNPAGRSHFTWFAGNDCHDNFENAVDNKNSYHVIASKNTCYNYRNIYWTPNSTAIILANDDEGPLSSLQWAIGNKIYASGEGVRFAGTAAETGSGTGAGFTQSTGQRHFALNNLMYDCDTPIVYDCRTKVDGTYGFTTGYAVADVVHNTCVAADGGQPLNQPREASNTHTCSKSIHGNIFYTHGSMGQTYDVDLSGDEIPFTRLLLYNLIDRLTGTAVVNSAHFDTQTGNVMNSDPGFTNISTNDYTISTGGNAANLSGFTDTPDAYTIFQNLYGMDIKYDYAGNARAATFSAGCFIAQ